MRFKTAGLGFVLASFALMIVFQNCSKVNSSAVSQETSSTETAANLTGDTVDEISLKLADTVSTSNANDASISVQINFEKKIVTIEQNEQRKEINLTEESIQSLRDLLRKLGPIKLNADVCTQLQNAISASDIMIRKSNKDWQNLGAYRDCESHFDLPFQQKSELISLIRSIVDTKIVRICPMSPISNPNCNADQILVEVRNNGGCLTGYVCRTIPTGCPEMNQMAPLCEVGQTVKAITNDQQCIVGFQCVQKNKEIILCPAIMTVMPECLDDSTAVPIHDERGCHIGYRCEKGEVRNPSDPPVPMQD